MFKALRAKIEKIDDLPWDDVTDEVLQKSVGGIPNSGEATSSDENERAVLDPNWEASPSALIRMLAWKQQKRR